MGIRHLLVSVGTPVAAGPSLAQTFTFMPPPAGAAFPLPKGVSNGGAVVVAQASPFLQLSTSTTSSAF